MKRLCKFYIWLLEQLHALLLWIGALTTALAGFLLLCPHLGVLISLLVVMFLALPILSFWNWIASMIDFHLPLWLPMPENYRVYRIVLGLTQVSSYTFLDYIYSPQQVKYHLEKWAEAPESSWAHRAYRLLSDYVDYESSTLKGSFCRDEGETIDRFLKELEEALCLE